MDPVQLQALTTQITSAKEKLTRLENQKSQLSQSLATSEHVYLAVHSDNNANTLGCLICQAKPEHALVSQVAAVNDALFSLLDAQILQAKQAVLSSEAAMKRFCGAEVPEFSTQATLTIQMPKPLNVDIQASSLSAQARHPLIAGSQVVQMTQNLLETNQFTLQVKVKFLVPLDDATAHQSLKDMVLDISAQGQVLPVEQQPTMVLLAVA